MLNSNEPITKNSLKKNIIFSAIIIVFMLVLFELLSSLLLIYIYRYKQHELGDFQYEVSYFSSVNLIQKVSKTLGYPNLLNGKIQFRKKTSPDPFIVPDKALGYSAQAGEYTHIFQKKQLLDEDWQSLKTKVTINKDGSRWTGDISVEGLPKIYIFGDSFVFGTGVNDEQTFASLLQNAMPSFEVKLFAFGGYSLTQAYIRFEKLKQLIRPQDIIVLGYSDFFDIRHVSAPSRVQEINEWTLRVYPKLMRNKNLFLPKAWLSKKGEIEVSYVNRSCAENNGYCEQSDPSRSEMTGVSAKLINHFSANTPAKVCLLHLQGNFANPVFELLSNKVNRISALPRDFDHFIHDDIEGFDPHPGPYWHYAIYQKLLGALTIK